MQRFAISLFVSVLLLSVDVQIAWAQGNTGTAETPASWTRPFPPFRIAGNLYYVGSYELGCFLITTSTGDILINTGSAGSDTMIRASMTALGFKLSDIKILLTSQAHNDHLGAMAEIQKLTHAKFMLDKGDSAVVSDGGKSDFAGLGFFEPVTVDRYLQNGDTIALGEMRMVMLHHPGHTKGSCSFLFQVKDSARSYQVLIANMPTIVTAKKFSSLHQYPGIAQDYAATLKSLKNLSFDIWLSPHASQFALQEKQKPGDPYHPEAFTERKVYDDELDRLQAEYQKKIEDN